MMERYYGYAIYINKGDVLLYKETCEYENDSDAMCAAESYCTSHGIPGGKYVIKILVYDEVEDGYQFVVGEEKEYKLDYFEVYNDLYTIKAKTREEAIEKLYNEISHGLIQGPTSCYDSYVK